MSLPLEREEIQLLTEELEVTIAAHLAWFKQINRTLVCANGVNKADLAEDAHLRTHFGQWYYSHEPNPLRENLDFLALGATQKAMHDATRLAFQSGVISDGELWMDMIRARNQSSHTYNLEQASAIAQAVTSRYEPAFQALREHFCGLIEGSP